MIWVKYLSIILTVPAEFVFRSEPACLRKVNHHQSNLHAARHCAKY